MQPRLVIALSALLALVAVAPASAQAQTPADVTRVENALTELSRQKKGSEGEVASRKRAAESALAACRSRGPGWARIRK